jgi:hypothetical protein
MDLPMALSKIRDTETNHKKVVVEYLGYDAKRGSAGSLKSVTGIIAGARHETMKHGTMVIVDERNKHHTVHTALIMKLNNEFVD